MGKPSPSHVGLNGKDMACYHCGARKTVIPEQGISIGGAAWKDFLADCTAFEKLHARCKETADSPTQRLEKDEHEWELGLFVGTSSATIFRVMTGRWPKTVEARAATPSDPSDFGRCRRLLKVMPMWRERLSEVAAKYHHVREPGSRDVRPDEDAARRSKMIQRRPSIDWLRAAAVISVMLYHGNGARHGLGVVTGTGWVGVDLFFVLSGFLVTRSWLMKPDMAAYLLKRAQRVLPAFWTCLLVGLGLGWLMGVPGRDVLTEAAYNLAFLGNKLPLVASFSILLGPLWSLATEVQFWLIIPVLTPVVLRHAWSRPLRTLLALLAVPVACRAVAAFIPGMIAPWGWGEVSSLFGPVIYALPFTHMDGLLLGVFLAAVEDRQVKLPSRMLVPALLLGLVAIAAGAPFRTYLPRPLVMVLFQYTALALGFGAAVLMAWRSVGTKTAPKVVSWYSERIFSLYLAQGIVGMLLSPLVIQTLKMGSLGQLAVVGVFVAISSAFGAGLYALVERPFASGLLRRLKLVPSA